MNASDNVNELATALAQAQLQMEPAKKDSLNPHFHSKYADLASIVDAIREPFAKNGLSYVQLPVTTAAEEVVVETVLLHTSGQWISSVFSIPVARDDAHGHMSALTYCRRGALAAIAGVAPEDDDGNAATESAARRNPEEQPIAARPVCPVCGKPTIMESKFEGQGWFCFKKLGGCGARWPKGPFPTAAPPDELAYMQKDPEAAAAELFPDPLPGVSGQDLVKRIGDRLDAMKMKPALAQKMWAESCGSAKFLDPTTDTAALTDYLMRIGGA